MGVKIGKIPGGPEYIDESDDDLLDKLGEGLRALIAEREQQQKKPAQEPKAPKKKVVEFSFWDVSRVNGNGRQYHLPGEHDQLEHGNWADGDKSPTSQLPEAQRKDFLRLEQNFSQDTKREHAAAAWSTLSDRIGSTITTYVGNSDTVKFDDHEMDMMRADGNVVLTHNHPIEAFGDAASVIGLSPDDLTFAAEADLKEMRAIVAHESGYYTFSVERPKDGWPHPAAIDVFLRKDKKLGKLYSALLPRMKLSNEVSRQINLAGSHARTKIIADHFGIKYRMNKVSDKNVRA